MSKIQQTTPYEDVNQLIDTLSQGLVEILAAKLVGIYLFGSLSYGDFNPDSSDIDLFVILHEPVSQSDLETLEQFHQRVGMTHERWARRLECSYTPKAMLLNTLPPSQPRPYLGEGIFYPEAHYGNEWIINLYLLYQHGIALSGPDFKTLIDPIPILEVQKACIRDLFQEWQPKIADPNWLDNSHYHSYIVLNLCRILYTVLYSAAGSKKVSARWVKNRFSEWQQLIQHAENWHYGSEMDQRDEAIQFIHFVIEQIKQTPLYTQLQ
jgi:predicted nucleotidyltransferase